MACEICGCPKVRWLCVRVVAEEFRCTPKAVRRLILKGEIDGVRFGKDWRIDHESLDEYVKRESVRFPSERKPPG
jgi:excisionase family DNA binding protein